VTAFKCKTRSHRVTGSVRKLIDGGGGVERWSGGCKYVGRNALAIPLVIFGLAGCDGVFRNPHSSTPPPIKVSVSVNPSSVTVAAGSTTIFTEVFTPSRPPAGSLTWSVTPAYGGTITKTGEYTASATAGNYMVVATWTPSNPSAGASISGSAVVEVLPPPQLGAELNTDLTQASGAIQAFGRIQNAGIVGQLVPSVVSTELSDRVQVRSGFTIPVACMELNNSCPNSDFQK